MEIASENVEQFVKRAGSLIQEGDIDSDVLAQIALNHDALRAQCEAAVKVNGWLLMLKKLLQLSLKLIKNIRMRLMLKLPIKNYLRIHQKHNQNLIAF